MMQEKASVFPLQGFALRPRLEGTRTVQLLATLVAITDTFELSKVVVGGRSLNIELTEASLREVLDLPEARFGCPHFPLGENEAFSYVAYSEENAHLRGRYSTVSLQLGAPQHGLANREDVLRFFSRLAHAFDASLGGLLHPDLKVIMLHRVLATDTGGIVLPAGARIPCQGSLRGIDENHLDHLSAIRHPREFDRSLVPETLWWANYWSQPVIDTIGRQRVDNAGWHERRGLESASLLVATPLPPRLGDKPGLERLAHIAASLRLHDLQSAAIPPDRFRPP